MTPTDELDEQLLFDQGKTAQVERVAIAGILLILLYCEYNIWQYGWVLKALLWWMFAVFAAAALVKWYKPNTGLIEP